MLAYAWALFSVGSQNLNKMASDRPPGRLAMPDRRPGTYKLIYTALQLRVYNFLYFNVHASK